MGGHPIANDFTRDDFANLYDPSVSSLVHDPTPPTPKRRVSTDPNTAYYNRYMEQGPYGFVLYKSVMPNEGLYVTMPTNLGGGTFRDMPIEIYNRLSSAKFLENFNANPRIAGKFLQLVTEGKTRIDREELAFLLKGTGPEKNKPISDPELNAIIAYFYNRTNIVSAPIPSNKKGGILKAQSGRVINLGYKPEETTLSRADEINERFTNPFAAQYIRKDGESQFWEGMSKTDG